MKKQFGMMLCMSWFFVSCSPTEVSTVRWSGQGAKPETPAHLDPQNKVLDIGSRQLQFQMQKIDDVEVEGATYKKIFQADQDEFISYTWLSRIPLSLRAEITLMKAEHALILPRFHQLNPKFKVLTVYEKPHLVIRDIKKPVLNWKIIYQEKNSELTAVYLDRKFQIIEKSRLGSQFDATAFLFPDGPLKSKISEVMLQKLSDDGVLRSDFIFITTQAALLAKAENNQFLYPTNDLRFGQVQVYFYLNQVRDWFIENFQFKLPFTLAAEMNVGYPEKTNTAFYYQHKIRLGEGDGIIFSDMSLDPSIIIHESLHAVIEAVSALPYTGQGGSLNEAFADFFTATILNNPNLGEVSYKKANFKRTINNTLRMSDAQGGLYHDSGIVSGLLWSISKSIGADKSQKLAWDILVRLDPLSTFESFQTELLSCLAKLEMTDQEKIMSVLRARGWL
ncbi:MAG: hypothetical protein A2622_00320 [Bdellovibrionales bacterium RIFCSPHIGHO2_01_FULL_40_29]|nr:MAG: hypothetical protein A2622_00320 [Bdellovibrionales bacterium RIFCSPHIGHO2_01_FULL_40_29]OFZ32569.1 MAG: hypothetical protein A3D17_04920 [Bdellovibrionales bacterium RIFCSPHIGHO2_02_FULL_40_15]